jgi:Na+(H+)/acetate symporter ActP
VRVLAVIATIVVSFTYVVAQIYAVGLIASRFTGVDFSVGIFLGLASILVCSFLGGMRAITWTQVAQYIIILVAFLIPTVWLSAKHSGNPVPQVAYGAAAQAGAREAVLRTTRAKPKCAPSSASAPTITRCAWPTLPPPGKRAASTCSASSTASSCATPRCWKSATPNGR